MEERIQKLEREIAGMQELMIALVIIQPMIMQMKLRRQFPLLDEFMKKH